MNDTPPQLRLYTENPHAVPSLPPILRPQQLDQLCQSFQQATGWELLGVKAGEPVPELVTWRHSVCGPQHNQTTQLVLVEPVLTKPYVAREAAIALAENLAETLDDLYHARTALWQREAQLATAVPLLVRPEMEDRRLARRLESVLQCAVQFVGAAAAALYVLDDDTRYLKLRAHWGLDDECFVSPPRRLRGSKGDLEALTGHAVVLERPDRCEAWDIPHPAAAALCVPVATAEIPLGTLWVFANAAREYSDAEVNLVEVIAGRLAVELEREILLRERLLARSNRDAKEASTWQRSQWSCSLPKLDRWQIAARPGVGDEFFTSVLNSHWHSDRRLGLTVGAADRSGILGSLAAATCSAAVQAHRTIVNPSRRLSRINDTVSGVSAGDQTLHVACGSMDLDTGKFQFALSGDVDAFVIRPHSWEPLSRTESGLVAGEAVGINGGVTYHTHRAQLAAGDVLLIVAGGKRPDHASDAIPRADAAHFAEAMLRHLHLSTAQLADYLVALSVREATVWHTRPAILVWRRLD